MMMKHKTLIPLATSLVAVLGLINAPARAVAQEWEKMPDTLFESLPDYDGSIPGARGVGGIVVDRHTGDLIACLNGPPWGVYRSSDAGETWTRIDDGNVEGGWHRSAAIQIDQTNPGRMAFFRVYPPGPEDEPGAGGPTSAITLDNGETWTVMPNPFQLQNLSGWSHGTVDWSKEVPWILAQGRVRPSITLSQDGGATFEKKLGKEIQRPNWNHEFMASRQEGQDYYDNWQKWKAKKPQGYGICGENILLGFLEDGIHFSADQGETFEKVAEFTVGAMTPVQFQGKMYWGTKEGVIVSDDCGKTWSLLGSELPNVVKGPFFGESADKLVVVTGDGVFGSADAGASWMKLADLATIPEAWRADHDPQWLYQDYAWDHTRAILYASGLASPIYKFQIK